MNRNNVSVIMTTYNGERFIRQQIESILASLNCGDELIIGDDGSVDDTLAILKEYCDLDKRIILFRNNRLGVNKNVEFLLSKCSKDIILIADQDDIWDINKIEIICQDFENNPQCDLVFHNAKVIDGENGTIFESLFNEKKVSKKFLDNVMRYNFWGCMFGIRKRALKYCLPIKFDFDNRIIFCVSYLKRCYLEDKQLICYRRHGGNVSTFKKRNYFIRTFDHFKKLIIFTMNIPRIKKYSKTN